MKRTGSCLCGAVTYTIAAQVDAPRSCHCSRCRKAYSAQASAYALVEPGSLTWDSGEDLLISYPPNSSFGKRFCGRCGSMLCGVVDGQVHGIALGCLDDDTDIEIKAHIFVASKAPWEKIPDGVPTYDEFPPNWPDIE